VGKKHLDNAVAVAGVSVQIQYEPFLVQDAHLDRLGYPEGVALIELLTKKYGREEAAQHFDVHHKRLTQAGKRVGIPFRTPWVQTVVRSADSHRLIEYCKAVAPAQTGVLVDALFKAYFEDGLQLSNHAHLVRVAESVGLNAPAVAQMLASKRYMCSVQEKAEGWSRKGVRGVPFFIIHPASGQPVILSGAQPVELIADTLRKHASTTV